MAQFLKIIAAIAIVFGFVKSSEAQTPNISADETVTYINAALHKYPTLEFVDSGCAGYEQVISISEDRRSLLVRQNFGQSAVGTCGDIQTLTVPIFSLNPQGLGDWSKQGQHSTFVLVCTNRTDCFSRRTSAQPFPLVSNIWFLRVTAPDQVSNEIMRAIQHLLDSLLTEANARLDSKDPFAKRVH